MVLLSSQTEENNGRSSRWPMASTRSLVTTRGRYRQLLILTLGSLLPERSRWELIINHQVKGLASLDQLAKG